MKSLIFGVVLIILLGVGGFVYRNVMETTGGPEGPTACTMEAKICPDGSSVGRTGPACEFAPCLPPNYEFAFANAAFVIPEGYAEQPRSEDTEPNVVSFEKPSLSGSPPHYITAWKLPIQAGKTAEESIIGYTRFSPSDIPAESMDDFTPLFVNGRTFQSVVIERFEGQVHSSYFLVRKADILRFDVIERDVTEWMNPALVVEELPEHKALLKMLATVQAGE